MTGQPHWRGIALDGAAALALLEWQREMGIDEPMLDEPVDRYAEPQRPPGAGGVDAGGRDAARPGAAMAGADAGGWMPAGRGAAGAQGPDATDATDATEGGGGAARATASAGAIPAGRSPAGSFPAASAPAGMAASSSSEGEGAGPPQGGAPGARAQVLADRAASLPLLAGAVAGFDGLEIRRGARNTVFADGNPAARVMVVTEAPDEDEDREGRPLVARAGQLFDEMMAAIGLSRGAPEPERAVYVVSALPWRPPGNRHPTPAETAATLPFLVRHVALADPQVLVLLGHTPSLALLGRPGSLRSRGQWAEALGRPALPMAHPAYLLRNPLAKREAWADLLSLRARREALGG